LKVHSLGNPNLQFHLIINNVGGQRVTVEGIELELVFELEKPQKIKAQNFIKDNEPNGQVLLSKFKVNSGEEWVRLTNFFNDFTKAKEKESKAFIKKARDDLQKKLKVKSYNRDMVEISRSLVSGVTSFLTKNSYGKLVNIR